MVAYYAYESVESPRGAVVLLHGFPECPLAWFSVVENVGEMGVDVLVPFLRGYGPFAHTFDESVETYHVDLVCNDIANVVRKHIADRSINKDKIVVVGHDWGELSAIPLRSCLPPGICSQRLRASEFLMMRLLL